jgi:hypothetical protein
MTDKPISDLRRRMIADMTIRTFGEKTRHNYVQYVPTRTMAPMLANQLEKRA